MQVFQELGALVESRWREDSYDEAVFPDLAAQALEELSPPKHLSPWDILDWVNRTNELPEQRDVDGKFGDPPITLFNGPRFYIDVYYWLDGTTSIHQHSFCGAFQVFLGSSILSQYSFEEKRSINAHFLAGNISLNKVELLEEGDIRRILPGKQYVHSLFHLDRPSVSIIIRTRQSPSGLPQYNYFKPYFAVDPFFREPTMIKRVHSASLLLRMRHPDADKFIAETLSCSDFQTAFSILDLAFNSLKYDRLERAFGLSTGNERFEAFLELARQRHGELVDLIPPVFEEAHRQQNLVLRRGQITSNEHRFFVALLLNVPDRGMFIDMVRQRFPDKAPVTTIVDWVEELANTKVSGSSEPNVLDIDDVDEDYLLVLQCLLEGLTLDQTREVFAEELSPDDAQNLQGKIEKLYDDIRNSMLFKSIFSDAAVGESARSLAI